MILRKNEEMEELREEILKLKNKLEQKQNQVHFGNNSKVQTTYSQEIAKHEDQVRHLEARVQ